MSGIQQMLLGGGGDTEIVGNGYWTVTSYDDNLGFSRLYGAGTISDGRFAPCGGAQILSLYSGGIGAYNLVLTISGQFGNSGFNTMQITNYKSQVTSLLRSNAAFSAGANETTWLWTVAVNTQFGDLGLGEKATVVFS